MTFKIFQKHSVESPQPFLKQLLNFVLHSFIMLLVTFLTVSKFGSVRFLDHIL